jgi:ketosteroid isomerase-like protein
MSSDAISRRRCWVTLACSLTFVATLLALTICSVAQEKQGARTHDLRTDEGEIRQKIAKYAKAADEADTTLASQVWLDSPDVSFIHPLGHERGFQQIEQNIYKHLMGDTFSERKLSIHDISMYVYGDAAWAEFYWDFAAKFRKDGSPVSTHGMETQIYRRTADGWRLVHVHYSSMPTTEEPKGF